MKFTVIIALLLVGCSTTSIDGLYQEQAACLSMKGDCADIAERIEQREKRMAEREYQNTRRCPRGYIEYCDQTMRGCGDRLKKSTDQFYCLTRQDILR